LTTPVLHLNPEAESFPPEIGDIFQDAQRLVAGYQIKMAEYLLDMACLDGLEGLASRHTLPLQFLIYLQKMMELCDESNRFFLGHLRRRGLSVQCTPNCTYCCQNMPAGMSLVELLYVYHGMHKSGIFARLFRRCLEADELLTQVVQQCRSPAQTGEMSLSLVEQALRQYQGLGQACRFSQGHLCQLYSFRPFACRMHFSLSPPAWCNPRHFQFPHALSFNLEPSQCVFDALDRIERRLQIRLSEILACGILELTVNVMRFERIRWIR
jgi:Fe-S-cluster containining protein